MTKGYTTIENVALYLGRTADGAGVLTDDQEAQAAIVIDAVESYIEHQTRRSWLNEPIINEMYPIPTSTFYLKQRPVESIEAIRVRAGIIGDPLRTLTPPTDYELLEPGIGRILLAAGNAGRNMLAYVDYTPNQPFPAVLGLAATRIVGHTLGMTLFPERWGVSSAGVDSRTHLTYTNAEISLTIPKEAQDTIVSFRRPIIT